MRKGLILPIILIVVVLGIVAIGSYVYFKMLPRNSTEQKPIKAENSKWETFVNNTSGYSVEYPKDWVVNKQGRKVFIHSEKSLVEEDWEAEDLSWEPALEISAEWSLKTLNEIHAESKTALEFSDEQYITLDGEQAIVFSAKTEDIVNTWGVLTKHNNFAYAMSLMSSREQDKEILDHAIASFKFLSTARVSSTPDMLKTKIDKYKGTDIYRLTKHLRSFYRENNKFPYTLIEAIQDTKYQKLLTDPNNKAYQYQQLDNGEDFQLQTTLANGTTYVLYSDSLAFGSAKDAYRENDLGAISTELKGYYMVHKKYPGNFDELVSMGYMKDMPKDPETDKPYWYMPLDNNQNYELSATLENGIEYYIRGDQEWP